MVKRAKALELAELIENNLAGAGDMEIAAELRQLHSLLAEAYPLLAESKDEIVALESMKIILLEALQDIEAYYPNSWAADRANAAIAKATGGQQ